MKCWWFFHDFPLWGEPVKQKIVTIFGEGIRSVQTRTCKRCGRMEVRVIE